MEKMGIPNCPLEVENVQEKSAKREVEVDKFVAHAIVRGKGWCCKNPKHPKSMGANEVFLECFERECYYLQKLF